MSHVVDDWLQIDKSTPSPVLILGLGNVLIEDEGIGVAALEYLNRHYRFDKNIELLDGGTSGMALLDDLRNREMVIVLDAVKTGHEPGEMVILRNGQVPAFLRNKVSPHQLALSDVLAILSMTDEQPDSIAVIGVEPVSLETRIGLSDKVRYQIQPIVDEVLTLICLAGYELPEENNQFNEDMSNPFHLV